MTFFTGFYRIYKVRQKIKSPSFLMSPKPAESAKPAL